MINTWQGNSFLSALTPDCRQALLEHAVERTLDAKYTLFPEFKTPKYAYLPITGLASVVAFTAEGQTSEIGFIGCEGVVGASHLLGPTRLPIRCFVRIEGTFIGIPFEALKSAYEGDSGLRSRILEFVQVDSLIVSQIAACNQTHQLEQRLARCFLMADDRRTADTINLTHEMLAEITASSRSAVTLVASRLNRQRLVSYSRGKIRILDRVGLESTACKCYAVAKNLAINIYSS